MNTRRIAIQNMVRLASRRVPRKALVEIGGERMIDRGCRQLRRIAEKAHVPAYLACWEGDHELVEAARDCGLIWVPITEEQSRSDD